MKQEGCADQRRKKDIEKAKQDKCNVGNMKRVREAQNEGEEGKPNH